MLPCGASSGDARISPNDGRSAGDSEVSHSTRSPTWVPHMPSGSSRACSLESTCVRRMAQCRVAPRRKGALAVACRAPVPEGSALRAWRGGGSEGARAHLEALHLRGDGVAHLEHDHADRVDVHLVVVRQRRALLRRHVERGADAARHLPRRAAHATIGTSPPLLRPLLMRVGRDRRDVAHAVER
eukprot:3038376-Prymnesium_polylepis.1